MSTLHLKDGMVLGLEAPFTAIRAAAQIPAWLWEGDTTILWEDSTDIQLERLLS